MGVTFSGVTQRSLAAYDEFNRQREKYQGDETLYQILSYCCFNESIKTLNAMVLGKAGEFSDCEPAYRERLRRELIYASSNRYLGDNTRMKVRLYLRCRPLYACLLSVKRLFHRKKHYGHPGH